MSSGRRRWPWRPIPSTRLGPGMGLVVRVLHSLRGQVRVDLRGAQRLMAQQLLHAAEVRAVVEQVRGEAMPQRVRADRRVQADLLEVLVELAADRARAEAAAVLVHEERPDL